MSQRLRRILTWCLFFAPLILLPAFFSLLSTSRINVMEALRYTWNAPGWATLFVASWKTEIGNVRSWPFQIVAVVLTLAYIGGLSIMAASGRHWKWFAIVLGAVIGGFSGFIYYALSRAG